MRWASPGTSWLALALACAIPVAQAGSPDRDEQLLQATTALFRAYEGRNATAFSGRGFPRSLYWSVQSDFANLRGIQFSEYVHTPVYDAAQTTARVSVTWFRRATFSSTNEEWIVRAQTSILVWDVTGDPPALVQISGAPLFGLSDATGTLGVRGGEINGEPVRGTRVVKNGRLVQPEKGRAGKGGTR